MGDAAERLDLRESNAWGKGPKVDREGHVVRGVKIVGLRSGNGNDYTLDVLEKAMPLYEGQKVNLDHPLRSAKKEDRRVSERWGKLQDVRTGDDGLYGDLLYNPHHPLTESILWWADNSPDCVGLSQYANGAGRKKANGRWQVESITSVASVDLVADPASTRSLFESQEPDMPEQATATEVQTAGDHVQQMADAFANAVMAVVKDTGLDLQGKMKKIKDILKAQEKLLGKEEEEAPAEEGEGEGTVAEAMSPERKELLVLRQEKLVRALCESQGYAPDGLMLEALVSLPGDERRLQMIEREKARQRSARPRSAPPAAAGESQQVFGGKQGKELASSLRKMR